MKLFSRFYLRLRVCLFLEDLLLVFAGLLLAFFLTIFFLLTVFLLLALDRLLFAGFLLAVRLFVFFLFLAVRSFGLRFLALRFDFFLGCGLGSYVLFGFAEVLERVYATPESARS